MNSKGGGVVVMERPQSKQVAGPGTLFNHNAGQLYSQGGFAHKDAPKQPAARPNAYATN